MLLAVCAAYQLGMGLYFATLRPPLLPEDLRFIGGEVRALAGISPRLGGWLHLVFTVLGGQMAAVGMLTAALALRLGVRSTTDWCELTMLGVAGALSVGTMSAVNLVLGSDFRWLLILPVVAWSIAILLAARTMVRAMPVPAGGPRDR